MTRQNYHARRRERQKRDLAAEAVVERVRRERRQSPRLGGRKLYYLLDHELRDAGVVLGRDRFFTVLRENGLLVERKRGRPHTTNSRHNLPVFTNLAKGLELTGPNQLWVADITYIRSSEGFLYLSLITDAYSRKIVGSHLDNTLETAGCLHALDMALKELPAGCYPIHHSDRGSQYASHLYVNKLHANGLQVSMTEENHCYENALAERVNGIMKGEYEMDRLFPSKFQAQAVFKQSKWIYNNARPHLSLNYAFPSIIHEGREEACFTPRVGPARAFGPSGHPCGDRHGRDRPGGSTKHRVILPVDRAQNFGQPQCGTTQLGNASKTTTNRTER